MDAPHYNGGPDDYPFGRRVRRVERTHGHGRCHRCGNPIAVVFPVEGFGDTCSFVCQQIVIAHFALARKDSA